MTTGDGLDVLIAAADELGLVELPSAAEMQRRGAIAESRARARIGPMTPTNSGVSIHPRLRLLDPRLKK